MPRRRLRQRPACRVEGLGIDLVPLCVEDGHHRYGTGHLPHGLGDDVERADAGDRAAGDQREAARRGDADSNAGERARADGDRDPVEVGEAEPGVTHRLRDHPEQPLGMAAADRFRHQHRRPAACGNPDGAAIERRIDGEEIHAPDHSIAGRVLRTPELSPT